MGIFNMFIVIPMIIQIVTLPLYYRAWLGENPESVLRLAGALLLCAAVSVLFVKTREYRAASLHDEGATEGAYLTGGWKLPHP